MLKCKYKKTETKNLDIDLTKSQKLTHKESHININMCINIYINVHFIHLYVYWKTLEEKKSSGFLFSNS